MNKQKILIFGIMSVFISTLMVPLEASVRGVAPENGKEPKPELSDLAKELTAPKFLSPQTGSYLIYARNLTPEAVRIKIQTTQEDGSTIFYEYALKAHSPKDSTPPWGAIYRWLSTIDNELKHRPDLPPRPVPLISKAGDKMYIVYKNKTIPHVFNGQDRQSIVNNPFPDELVVSIKWVGGKKKTEWLGNNWESTNPEGKRYPAFYILLRTNNFPKQNVTTSIKH